MSTRLLIDGYNLLFASGVSASRSGPPTLQRTRDALLQLLADCLDSKLLGRTIVVFDATQAPPGLPQELGFAGMKILFSRRGQEADALLEDLIAAERAPRELLVVSSDHRVQRAARQRGAKYVDSDQWLRELTRSRQQSASETNEVDDLQRSSSEVQRWLAEFGSVDARALDAAEPLPLPNAAPRRDPDSAPPPAKPRKKVRQGPVVDEKPRSFGNPFPPGYGEDLLDEDNRK
jgi:predicted RNA-binding protein with PIN domain